MFTIIKRRELNPTVTELWIHAPLIAKKAKAGQFIIVRAKEDSERIPLTIAGFDREAGTVSIIFQVVGAGTSTIESVPCAIALVELAQTDPNRCAVLCANLGGDTDTIGAMATAICGALHGVNAIDPALKAELDAVNQLDFNRYATALAKYRQQREAV